MAKKHKHAREPIPHLAKKEYARALHRLQIELVELHRHLISHDLKMLVILEGRDGAGKDGATKRIVEHLSPREVLTRVPTGKRPSRHTRPDSRVVREFRENLLGDAWIAP
jgi:polyphosphate kinase 2 (PPK2 family)